MNDELYFDTKGVNGWEIRCREVRCDALAAVQTGTTLNAWWDAGGDDIPGAVQVQPEGSMSKELQRALFVTIIRVLNLPGAGFTYDEGTADLFFDAEENLRIRFNSRERGRISNVKRSDEIRIINFKDPLHIAAMGNRLRFHLSGRINDYKKIHSWTNLEVREGEAPDFSDELKLVYKKQVEDLLREYETVFDELPPPENPEPGEINGGEINADFAGFEEGKFVFKISFRFEAVFEHRNEEMILIDKNDELQSWGNRSIENY